MAQVRLALSESEDISGFLFLFILYNVFINLVKKNQQLFSQVGTDVLLLIHLIQPHYKSHLVGKPTMWFPNRSDTTRPVQAQKQARSLKFGVK